MRLAAIFLCFAVLLSGCGASGVATGSASQQTASPAEPSAAGGTSSPTVPSEQLATQTTANPLAETTWVLTSIDGAAVPTDPVVRLEFTINEASGFAGCNFFGGSYQAEGSTLRLQEIAQTAMLCEDEALMRQESSFLDALRATNTYTLQGETLELRDESGAARLVLRSQERQATDPTQLHDTRWRLESIGGETPAGERPITLELMADGTAIGDAGCRTYAATWQVETDRIDFPMIEMIGEVCAEQELLEQEGTFTDVLSTAHTYRLVDGQLELRSDHNGPLRFTSVP